MDSQTPDSPSKARLTENPEALLFPADQAIRRIVLSYDDIVTRLYSVIRFTILRQPFLEEIEQYMPTNGRVLDLGCGFGLFSLYFASLAPGRHITGVDLNRRRIERAATSARKLGIKNVDYHAMDVLDWEEDQIFDAIYFLDLVHHLPREMVPGFLDKVRSLLSPGGVLIIKDIADRPYFKMLFTLLLDRLMVGMEPIYYWPPSELMRMLRELGFTVYRHRMTDILPYSHILYVATASTA